MKKDIIKKSNSLTVAYYNLSLVEYRVLHMVFTSLAEIEPNPELFKNARFTVRATDYMELYGVDRTTAYEALREASERLFNRYFTYDLELSPEHQLYERLKARWVTKIGYIEQQATVTLYLSEEVLSMVGKLTNRYTTYFLNQTSELTSMYAIRIYEMLVQWRQAKVIPSISVEELRSRLDIKDNEYPRMHDFKRNVLDLAVTQINERTDLKVSYTQEKAGRKITGFTFKFKVKEDKKKKVDTNRDSDTPDMFTGMTDKEKKYQSWRTKGLSDAQISKLAIYTKEFVDANSSKVSPKERRGYPAVFNDWKPLLKDPKTVGTFNLIQELLERTS